MCAGTDGLQSAAPGQKSLEAYPTELCRANPFPAKKRRIRLCSTPSGFKLRKTAGFLDKLPAGWYS